MLREDVPLLKVIQYCNAVELAEKSRQQLKSDVLRTTHELTMKDKKKIFDAGSNTRISSTDDDRRAKRHCSRCKKKYMITESVRHMERLVISVICSITLQFAADDNW